MSKMMRIPFEMRINLHAYDVQNADVSMYIWTLRL